MKPQDILFLVSVFAILFFRNPRIATIAGLLCLLAAIPLFHFWVFFTAERLTWYAAGFFLIAIVFYLKETKRYEK